MPLLYYYSFYLSFENSVCDEYVTEKFFKYLDKEVVPVVLGGADYSRVAPPHSYLDARHFDTPLKLAVRMLELERDRDAYQEYFRWKQEYDVLPNHGWVSDACHKCYLVRQNI